MKLLIKPFSPLIKSIYSEHGHFHSGDAGIDLYTLEDQLIEHGQTKKIHFGIACENLDSNPYLLIPRSSISKTPLRMSNSIGLIDAGYRGEIMASVDNIKKGITIPMKLKNNSILLSYRLNGKRVCPIKRDIFYPAIRFFCV